MHKVSWTMTMMTMMMMMTNSDTMFTCFCLSFFQEIDEYICQAKDKSYDTLVHFGRKGLNVAATAAVMAATKVMQALGICFVLTWAYSRRSLFKRVARMSCCFAFLIIKYRLIVCYVERIYTLKMVYAVTMLLTLPPAATCSRAKGSCQTDWGASACRTCLPTSRTPLAPARAPRRLQPHRRGPGRWCAASRRATTRVSGHFCSSVESIGHNGAIIM